MRLDRNLRSAYPSAIQNFALKRNVAMSRGPVFVSAKIPADLQLKAGGSVPVAKIFLPQLSSAPAIRLVANSNRRIAEVRPRRPT